MSTETNPYAPPAAEVADISGVNPEVEAYRREHLKHESAIRSIGLLYYLSAFGLSLGFVALVFALLLAQQVQQEAAAIVLAVVYGLFAMAFFALGHGLRRLKAGARIPAIILSFVGLLAFPLGTLINGYILYLLMSAKGMRVFESDYADIVSATPHIKYRTSIVIWILLAILLLILLGIMAAVIVPNLNR